MPTKYEPGPVTRRRPDRLLASSFGTTSTTSTTSTTTPGPLPVTVGRSRGGGPDRIIGTLGDDVIHGEGGDDFAFTCEWTDVEFWR